MVKINRFLAKDGCGFFSAKAGSAADRIEFLSLETPLVEVEHVDADSDWEANPQAWLFVAKFFDNVQGGQGWVRRDGIDIDEGADFGEEIDEAIFVREAIGVEYVFNRKPEAGLFFADADFMIAWAFIESGLKNLQNQGPDSARQGPFGLSVDIWSQFLESGFASPGTTPLKILAPLYQIDCAAWLMHSYAKRLAALQAQAGNGNEENPYLPRFGELLRCHLIGVDRTFAMQAKLKDGDGSELLPGFLVGTGMSEADAETLMNDRRRFMRSGGNLNGDPLTLKGFHDKCAEVLNKQLKAAFSLIKQYVPEAVETPPVAGAAPWLDFARDELAAEIKEATEQGRARIRQYFQSINHAGTFQTPWCGAFVAWCMKQCGGEVADSVVKLKGGPAFAASWQHWGDMKLNLKSNPPVGAVVLLSPSRETDDISHVGFFKSYDDEKRLVTILGGNQGDKVSEIPFKASDVVGIRFMSVLQAKGAVHIGSGAPIPAGREDNARTICNLFAEAGYGRIQQIAALANAIRESSLNEKARGDGGLSIGLFQCHTTRGAGIGHKIADLEKADYNTRVIISVARKYGSFANTDSLEKAVEIFVVSVERPANQAAEIQLRIKIASDLRDLLA